MPARSVSETNSSTGASMTMIIVQKNYPVNRKIFCSIQPSLCIYTSKDLTGDNPMNIRNFSSQIRNVALALPVLLSTTAVAQPAANANAYIQHNLVSDVAGQADVTDPHLVNPWGISETASSPFWVSDNTPGLATLYNGAGAIAALVVTIPPGAATQGIGSPTGQVAGNGTSWILPAPNGKAASFIFATHDGTISA